MVNNIAATAYAQAVRALQTMRESDVRALTTFEAACMLLALPDSPELSDVRQHLADRLQKNLSDTWITERPLYEAFSCLAALWRHDTARVSGAQLACAIQRLINTETAVGGPYSTQGAPTVADNASIALFTNMAAKELPNVATFLDNAAQDIAAHKEPLAIPAIQYLLSKTGRNIAPQKGKYTTPIQCCIALLGNKNIEAAVQALCQLQAADGTWEDSLTSQPSSSGRYVATAIAIEALNQIASPRPLRTPQSLQQHQNVVIAANKLFNPLPEPLRNVALRIAKEVYSADEHYEITLLPYTFGHALTVPTKIKAAQYTTLGVANVCSWMAYSIYDDVLDEEGNPLHLSAANVAMRAALQCFHDALPGDNNFQIYAWQAYTTMDAANTWEVMHCRARVHDGSITIPTLPVYGNRKYLADRSMAHVVPVMAVLAYEQYGSAQSKAIEQAMRNYLIAKQLNDDMHDWQEDLRMGRLSYVATAILRDAHVQPGTRSLTTLIPALQRTFRHTTMLRICNLIRAHVDTARELLKRHNTLQPNNAIYDILDRLEASVRHSLDLLEKSQSLTAHLQKTTQK